MKVSLIIPTYNGEKYLEKLLNCLLNQGISVEILLVDSQSTDETIAVAKKFEGQVQVISIAKESFNHGATRNMAFRKCTGDIVIFMTQDALPVDNGAVERLLRGFSSEDIAAVYGRQIPYKESPEYEKLTRAFNYPEEKRIWREEDIETYGVKSYFFSNAFAAYRRTAWEQVGGFDEQILTNEDMLIAAKFLHQGFALAYVPDAQVYHSHKFSLREDYRRNYKIGYTMEQYKERLYGANSNQEGVRMVRFVTGNLLKKMKLINLFSFCCHVFVRLMANKMGKRAYRKKA